MTEAAQRELRTLLGQHLPSDPVVRVNTGERISHSDARVQEGYVTFSGSAIDYGKDGFVGRGNGRGGLITPARRAGNEALFGKNPAYHVGKVGGLLADRLATNVASLGARCAAAVVYDKGDLYSRPRWCHVTTSEPLDTSAVNSCIARTLSGDSWLPALVDEQRYLPRTYPLSDMLDLLKAARE